MPVGSRRCASFVQKATLAEAKAEQARTFGELLSSRRLLATLIWSEDSELSATFAEEVAPPNVPTEAPTLNEQLAIAQKKRGRSPG